MEEKEQKLNEKWTKDMNRQLTTRGYKTALNVR